MSKNNQLENTESIKVLKCSPAEKHKNKLTITF